MAKGAAVTKRHGGITPEEAERNADSELMRSLFKRLTLRPTRTVKSKKKKTSPYRGVSWSSLEKGWRAVIEVGGVRYKLGVFESDKDAALAYDAAAEALNVPQRRNFGAHDPYPNVALCDDCFGLGRRSGEFMRRRRDGGLFIVRMGPGKDCAHCEGRGYFLKEQNGER